MNLKDLPRHIKEQLIKAFIASEVEIIEPEKDLDSIRLCNGKHDEVECIQSTNK